MQKQVVKFDLKDLLPIGLTLVVMGIGIAYGLNVMSDVKTDMTECGSGLWFNSSDNLCYNGSSGSTVAGTGFSAEWNATNDAITGVAKLPEKMPLIATVIVAAVIIGVLVRYLVVKFM